MRVRRCLAIRQFENWRQAVRCSVLPSSFAAVSVNTSTFLMLYVVRHRILTTVLSLTFTRQSPVAPKVCLLFLIDDTATEHVAGKHLYLTPFTEFALHVCFWIPAVHVVQQMCLLKLTFSCTLSNLACPNLDTSCRMNVVRDCFHQWLRHEISTDQLDEAVRRELTGDHPDDTAILESFRWFVAGSHQFYGRASQTPSPRCSEESDSLLMQ